MSDPPHPGSTFIPSSLAPFFQEYDLAQLEVQRSAATIIERVLQYGNRAEIRWLFQVYPQERIADWVRIWGEDALPEPHLTFWKLVLDPQESRYGYGYPMVAPYRIMEGMRLASVADIGLMKMDALLARASRKDFHDLYAICQRIALQNLLDLAPQKYPATRDFETQVAKRLVYFERAEQEEPLPLIEQVSWETVKAFFRQQATGLVKGWLI